MTRICCIVERITYQNPDNGYSVLKVRVKEYNDLVPLVGNLIDVNVGSVLLVEGNWKVDRKFGREFIAEKWEETMPATVYGIEKYLGSGLIKGGGSKFVQRIVAMFGVDTIAVIEDSPERLIEVPGIGRKRVEMLRDIWGKHNPACRSHGTGSQENDRSHRTGSQNHPSAVGVQAAGGVSEE